MMKISIILTVPLTFHPQAEFLRFLRPAQYFLHVEILILRTVADHGHHLEPIFRGMQLLSQQPAGQLRRNPELLVNLGNGQTLHPMSIQLEEEVVDYYLEVRPYGLLPLPDLEADHPDESELERGDRNGEENDLPGYDLGLGGEQMRLCKLLDLPGLEFAGLGHKRILHQIHLLIAEDNQTVRIDPQQFLSREVELHLLIGLGFQHGLG